MAELIYHACPFCGWCRPIKYGGRLVAFDKVDPAQVKVVQVRELTGGIAGMPKGGHIIIKESQRLAELSAEIKDQIKNQCQKILAELG